MKNSGYMGDCEIIWKWWTVFILAVSYNTVKITQAPKREKDWRPLGNRLLILAHSLPPLKLYTLDTVLWHISQKGSSLLYLSIQHLLDVLQNSYPSAHNIVLPNVILRTYKVIAREFPLPGQNQSRIRGSKYSTLWWGKSFAKRKFPPECLSLCHEMNEGQISLRFPVTLIPINLKSNTYLKYHWSNNMPSWDHIKTPKKALHNSHKLQWMKRWSYHISSSEELLLYAFVKVNV